MLTLFFLNTSSVKKYIRSFFNALRMLINGNFGEFRDQFKIRFYSKTQSFGLRRDILKPFQNPEAKIDISVRRMNENDIEPLLGSTDPNKLNSRILKTRLNIIRANIPNCYVAVNSEGKAGYLQWLIGPEYNDQIQTVFDGAFPVLKENEALLEAAYMNPSFRGLWVMPAAMSRIAEKAVDLGVRWAITFVDINNIPSLKGCWRAGFSPYILREVEWFLFRKKVTYKPIPEDTLRQFQQKVGYEKEAYQENVFAQ